MSSRLIRKCVKVPLKKIIYAAVVLSWLAGMGLLADRHYIKRPVGAYTGVVDLPAHFFEEHWQGVYLKGEKTGYSFNKITRTDDGYLLDGALKVRLKVLDSQKNFETRIRASLDRSLQLVSFDSDIVSDFSMKVSGSVKGKKLLLVIDAGDRKFEHAINIDRAPSLDVALVPSLLKNGLTEGRRIQMPVFDPSGMNISDWAMEVSGRESILSMGQKLDAYRLKGSYNGLEFMAWVTGDGEVIRQETPLGFTLVKESKEEAMRYGQPSKDIILSYSVPFNLVLPDNVSYLRVRVSGTALEGLSLDGGRQRLRGDVLEIEKEELGSGQGMPQNEKTDDYLNDTMFIQSKAPQIISAARSITKGEKEAEVMARLINSWVYANIEKVPVIGVPSALEVLSKKQGDCNEHATLFTGLARAAGIPARIATGLVYRDKAFYYHAWPEIYVGRWVAIDPTLGQFPADASHIRLLTGELGEQMRLLPIIGRIRLEGLEYR
ncbi:MAG: transglutaminase domain-containing protein [Nitrospirae bacterium]|nr:transglutaminase domain-containing protein [Nitrospirota bacterium]